MHDVCEGIARTGVARRPGRLEPGPARAGAKRRWSWRRRHGCPRCLAAPSPRSPGGAPQFARQRGLARRHAREPAPRRAGGCRASALALDGRANLERLAGIADRVVPVRRGAALGTLDRDSATAAAAAERSCRSAMTRPEARSTASELRLAGAARRRLVPGLPAAGLREHDTRTTRSCTCCTATIRPTRSFLQIGLQRDARPADRAARDRAADRGHDPGWAGIEQLAQPRRDALRSYVLEVQQLVDRMLPTIPARGARAIAGYSMGGYGAMHVALDAPASFSACRELARLLQRPGRPAARRPPADLEARPARVRVRRRRDDVIADPSENAPFAAALRAAGADAHSAVYPGRTQLCDARSAPRIHARVRCSQAVGRALAILSPRRPQSSSATLSTSLPVFLPSNSRSRVSGNVSMPLGDVLARDEFARATASRPSRGTPSA